MSTEIFFIFSRSFFIPSLEISASFSFACLESSVSPMPLFIYLFLSQTCRARPILQYLKQKKERIIFSRSIIEEMALQLCRIDCKTISSKWRIK